MCRERIDSICTNPRPAIISGLRYACVNNGVRQRATTNTKPADIAAYAIGTRNTCTLPARPRVRAPFPGDHAPFYFAPDRDLVANLVRPRLVRRGNISAIRRRNISTFGACLALRRVRVDGQGLQIEGWRFDFEPYIRFGPGLAGFGFSVIGITFGFGAVVFRFGFGSVVVGAGFEFCRRSSRQGWR